MGRACSTNGERRNAYKILVGKPEGKRPPSSNDEVPISFRNFSWRVVDGFLINVELYSRSFHVLQGRKGNFGVLEILTY
jgi:hypothetical protein